MNALNRYVLRQLAVGMILVTAGLTCVIWLTQSLRFVEMIVNRGLSAGSFVYLTMLLLPNFLSIILPIALFTIVVFTYSKMIGDRELVVMRATGMNQNALARPALILAMVVVGIGYWLNLYLLPQSYSQFRELQWDIRYNYSHILLQEGVFNTVSKGITVYIRERSSDGQLHGILVQDERKPAKPYTLMAERGAMVQSPEGARVIMFNGNRQEVDRKTARLSILYFDRYIFDLGSPETIDESRYREARERSLMELFNLDKDKRLNPKDYGKFTIEAHKRLTAPLTALGFTLVALACLISGSFSRRNQARRTILAVAVIVTLQGAALGLENLSARNLDFIPLMYVNAVLPIVLGYIFMHRHPRRRPTTDVAPAGAAAGRG